MENTIPELGPLFTKANYIVSNTRKLPYPNSYALALLHDYPLHAMDEEKAPKLRGQWRLQRFACADSEPLDLEIGTGNGFHFADFVKKHPQRAIVGLELKYKPLIQTVRRALDKGGQQFVVARYDARMLEHLFAEQELNNVYIHFPDPWAKKEATLKHRLLQVPFLEKLYALQRPGSFVDFKTDHHHYYLTVKECLKHTSYQIERDSEDLHHSPWASENFQTHFEKLWTSKGIRTNYLRFVKPLEAASPLGDKSQ